MRACSGGGSLGLRLRYMVCFHDLGAMRETVELQAWPTACVGMLDGWVNGSRRQCRRPRLLYLLVLPFRRKSMYMYATRYITIMNDVRTGHLHEERS